MAIKLGDLYVHLSARNTEFGRGMAAAGAMVSKFAMQVKAAGAQLGGLGMMMTTAMGATLMKAAAHSRAVAAELASLKQSSAALAVQIAQALLPAVHAVSNAFSRVAGFLERLDPALKQQLGTWAAIAAGTLLAVGAFSKLMGVVGVLGKVMQGVGMLLGSGVLLPMIAIIGIVAGLITIVGLASQAWDEFGDGITEVLKGIWDKVKSVFTKVADVIGTALSYVQEALANMLRAVGMDAMADALMDPSGVLSKLKSFGETLIDFGVETGKSVRKGFEIGLEKLGIFEVIKDAKGMLADLFGGAPANYVATPTKAAEKGPGKAFLDVAASVAKTRGEGQEFAYGGGAISDATRKDSQWLATVERAREAHARLTNAVNDAGTALRSELLSKFGKLGTIIDAAKGPVATSVSSVAQAAGAGSAAGPIGALIGVLLAFITESQPFVEVVSMVGAVVQTLADALGGILTPVSSLIAALLPIAEALGELVAPIFLIVEIVAGALIPPLIAFGMMLKAFTPLMTMLVTVYMAPVLAALSQFLPQLQILFDVFRFVGVGILELTRLFAPFWNGIISTVTGFLRNIAKLEFRIGEMVIAPFASLGGLADSLDKTIVSVDGIQGQIDALNSLTWKDAQAKAESIKATTLQTEAVEAATAAMLNVPTGFNVAMERWRTIQSSSQSGLVNQFLGGGGLISSVDKPPGFAVGGVFKKAKTIRVAEGGEVEAVAPLSSLAKFVRDAVREEGGGRGGSVIININGAGKNAEQIAREVKLIFERETFRKGRGRLGNTNG